MSSIQNLKVKIVFEKKETPGEVKIQTFSKKEKGMRALKSLGIFWGAAVASILIPFAHFILVPGFLLAGVAVPFYIYSTDNIILEGAGVCPKCAESLVIHRSAHKWPLREICKHCRVDVVINKVNETCAS